MTKRRENFEISAGDSIIIEDTVQKDDGSTKDVSDYSAQFTLADYAGDSVVVQYTEADSNLTVADGQNDIVTVELDSTDTEDLGDPGNMENRYYYELELEDPSGKQYTVTTGQITIYPSY